MTILKHILTSQLNATNRDNGNLLIDHMINPLTQICMNNLFEPNHSSLIELSDKCDEKTVPGS